MKSLITQILGIETFEDDAEAIRAVDASPFGFTCSVFRGSDARFERYFGGTRLRTSGKLKEIGELRNAVFHFKRDITVDDHNTLAVHREWLRSKLQLITSIRNREGAQ